MLSPKIGFELFPAGDNPFMFITVKGSEGDTASVIRERSEGISEVLS